MIAGRGGGYFIKLPSPLLTPYISAQSTSYLIYVCPVHKLPHTRGDGLLHRTAQPTIVTPKNSAHPRIASEQWIDQLQRGPTLTTVDIFALTTVSGLCGELHNCCTCSYDTWSESCMWLCCSRVHGGEMIWENCLYGGDGRTPINCPFPQLTFLGNPNKHYPKSYHLPISFLAAPRQYGANHGLTRCPSQACSAPTFSLAMHLCLIYPCTVCSAQKHFNSYFVFIPLSGHHKQAEITTMIRYFLWLIWKGSVFHEFKTSLTLQLILIFQLSFMRMIQPAQNMTKYSIHAGWTSWTDCETALKWGRLKSRHIIPD